MENSVAKRNEKRERRTLRVRKHVRGTSARPRLSVFKTNKHISVQLIDDEKQATIASIGTMHKNFRGTKLRKKSKEAARQVGMQIAELAKGMEIQNVVFDRGRLKFHGIIAELANAARESGLKF